MPPILLGGREKFKPRSALIGERGLGLRDLLRRANRLRRQVYRETPVGAATRSTEFDHRMCYADLAAVLRGGKLALSSEGAALTLWRACTERGLRAWCYRYGFPSSLTQTVTIVEIDGVLQIHDAYFNLSYPSGLYDVLSSLRNGETVPGRRELRDRKIYIMDPAAEPSSAVRWLEEHADRELETVNGGRRFELLWNPEAFVATHPATEALFGDLAAHGFPADLQFAMLHPLAVFDGTRWHCERTEMPLLSGRDLQSPSAALRLVSRDLETERARLAETTAAITRLEADLAAARSQASAASRRFAAERETWLQRKAALQAGRTALEGELAETRARLSSAIDLRAQRDSQIAQLRAEIEDAEQQIRQQQKMLDTLVSRAEAADEQVIALGHYFPALLDEVNRLRCERDAMSRERARLEAQIAASFSARLQTFWRRLLDNRTRR
jgi:predicted  nucleic acid-binding Zn-ribbon protein